MKALGVVVLCIAVVGSSLCAEGGSAYSILGIGDLRYGTGTRNAGMGYAGLALGSTNYINALSPAAWSRISRTRIEAGMFYEGFTSKEGNASRFLSTGRFGGALLAIPISSSHGIVFVGGFTPYSTVNYDIFTTGSQLGIDYDIEHAGTGGLTKSQAGFSYAPTQGISIGASFDYISGFTTSTRKFSPSSTTSAGASITEELSARGSGFTLGFLAAGLGDIAEGLRAFSLGIAFQSRISMRTTRQLKYEFLAERDTTAEESGKVALPYSLGIGVGYQPGERYLMALDWIAQPWSEADLSGIQSADLRNSYRVGVGGERLPSRDTFAPWYEKLTYRAGFYYDATYYSVNGEPINQWGATAGFAIPVSGENKLNFSFEYAHRGTMSKNLIEDRIVRFTVSLNISELWFVQYDEE